MKLAPDLNDTLRRDGPDAVRARMDGAKKYNGSGAHRLIIPSGEFVANYTPPDYALDGILQKKRVYSLTGRTGDGKTAIKLDLTYRFAANVTLAGREVSRCRVLYLAGENPDDVRGRWIAMGDHLGLRPRRSTFISFPASSRSQRCMPSSKMRSAP